MMASTAPVLVALLVSLIVVCMLALPVLVGVLFRVVGKKVNPDLLSLLGAAVVLLFFGLSNKVDFGALFTPVASVWPLAPVFSGLLLIVACFGALAIPYLLIRTGVNLWDRHRLRRESRKHY
jgi:hypothetical protein